MLASSFKTQACNGGEASQGIALPEVFIQQQSQKEGRLSMEMIRLSYRCSVHHPFDESGGPAGGEGGEYNVTSGDQAIFLDIGEGRCART